MPREQGASKDPQAVSCDPMGFTLCHTKAADTAASAYTCMTVAMHMQDHPISNAWTVGAPYMLLYYLVARFLWPKISTTAYFSLAPWDVWPFLW